jgi:dienelactone hydrolase
MERWVSRVNGWGFAALVLDSMTPRGVSGVCPAADQPKVTVVDRSGDVVSAALFLRGIKEIDPGRIAVMGFSHGGGTAQRTTVWPAGPRARPLLKAAIDYYGSCAGAVSYTGLPLLAMAGADDDWGMPAATCANFGRAVGPEAPFEVVAYPGVVHAFDNPGLTRRVTSNGHALQYDRDAAEDSFVRVRAFLDRYVK